jgi:hypothetical protein
MIDHKEYFEKLFGKKESSENIQEWKQKFELFFLGWMKGWSDHKEELELEKEERSLSDFQRGQ